ncbi:class I ribonucleotide reductase maintenance protein YfaE [Spartinivicinus poritis]|uniref:Class I ribonucleotide reductase maintenance protein YfaE n=1 Tax=Spartinivicinus poritis TaxID=2994640 RepID=A0ABT5U786_9GAMM|nr:class I ribonucleotide reductase maintenance protein YfaE [Spartinivicinus sp. A2-2]MDE1462060.1 class I ribonucleotide reductase maintenance protein YfaE [Spartinivicinus sp. A2-2]
MANIIKIIDGFSFIPREEHTLLEAMEAQQLVTEYQCRQGYCGACQVELINGNIKYTEEPIAFTPKGRILACCAKPTSDITIELPYPVKRKTGEI